MQARNFTVLALSVSSLVGGVFLAGCDRPEVHSYRVPKSDEKPTGIGAMLAAGGGGANPSLPPRAGTGTGTGAGASANARGVAWTLPAGWKEVPSTQQMRIATFDAGGVEVTLSAFPGAAGGVLPNVNRWRGQIGLEPVDDAGLAALLTTTREGASDVSLLSMAGKDGKTMLGAIIVPGDGQTWFVKATTDSAKADALRGEFAAFSKSFRMGGGDAAATSAPPATPATTPAAVANTTDSAAIDARLARFTPPAGWTVEAVGGNIVAAAFTAKNDAGGARVTATSLGNDGGGDLANINRWRGQLGLAPMADLAAVEKSDLVAGLLTVDLRNADGSDRMISVIAPAGASTWFFKLRGSVAGVEAERARFAAFVREVAQGAKP